MSNLLNLLATIRDMEEKGIKPNAIRIHPKDLSRLSKGIVEKQWDISTILGLRVIETTTVEEGKPIIYNDEVFYGS